VSGLLAKQQLRVLVEMEILADLGRVAGIGGIAIGALLVIFRDVVRKNVFSNLPPETSFSLLRLIVVLTWTVAVLGLLIWAVPSISIAVGSGITIQTVQE